MRRVTNQAVLLLATVASARLINADSSEFEHMNSDCQENSATCQHGVCSLDKMVNYVRCDCNAGYHGMTCAQKCNDFYFGKNCAGTCKDFDTNKLIRHCKGDAPCDHVTGTCGQRWSGNQLQNVGCSPGYKGYLCDQEHAAMIPARFQFQAPSSATSELLTPASKEQSRFKLALQNMLQVYFRKQGLQVDVSVGSLQIHSPVTRATDKPDTATMQDVAENERNLRHVQGSYAGEIRIKHVVRRQTGVTTLTAEFEIVFDMDVSKRMNVQDLVVNAMSDEANVFTEVMGDGYVLIKNTASVSNCKSSIVALQPLVTCSY